MTKQVRVELRDMTVFMIVMIGSVLVYGVANAIVLYDCSYYEFRQGNIEAGRWLGYSAQGALLLSALLIAVFFAVLGTILKRLNKHNEWADKHP